MGRPAKKLTPERVERAIREHHGDAVTIARALGLAFTQAFYQYVREHPELQEILAEARNGLTDIAESNVAQKVIAGDDQMTRFYLERKAKHRGWGRSQDVNIADMSLLYPSIDIATDLVDPNTRQIDLIDYERINYTRNGVIVEHVDPLQVDVIDEAVD